MNLGHVCIVAALSASSTTVFAAGSRVYLKGGTLGVGVGYAASLSESSGARIGANFFDHSRSDDYEGNRYDAKLKFSSIEALADFYLAGGFRITGGAIYSANKLDLAARLGPGNTFKLNGVGYPVNSASAVVDLGRKRVAPYLGIGYSSRPGGGAGFGFHFDAGILRQGASASIAIDANPGITSDPVFQANKAQAEIDLREAVSDSKNWPVLSFGVTYTF